MGFGIGMGYPGVGGTPNPTGTMSIGSGISTGIGL
jgi:hypothetical protein